MATCFLRIQTRFSYIFNNISWELPNITSRKSPKTSDSWNTEFFPIPTAIFTKTCSFELKYKGRRTRNTQVCRHKITAYVYLSYMSSCARPISEKLFFKPFLKSWFSNIFWDQYRKQYVGLFWYMLVPDGPQSSPKPITSCSVPIQANRSMGALVGMAVGDALGASEPIPQRRDTDQKTKSCLPGI